jgi:hypothetical protein
MIANWLNKLDIWYEINEDKFAIVLAVMILIYCGFYLYNLIKGKR